MFLDLAAAARDSTIARVRDAIAVEKAYFEAFHRRNPAARTWLAEIQGAEVEKHTRWRAEAAVLFVEGRYAAARAKAQDALAEVPNSADRGGSRAEAVWLQILLGECDKRLAANES